MYTLHYSKDDTDHIVGANGLEESQLQTMAKDRSQVGATREYAASFVTQAFPN
jgi:hypothetical protein